MNFFKNTWIIGIVTGIISGILVYFITSKFFDSKGKKEYASHVREANKDVINALKPYIAEQGLPDFEVLKALILSTARKNGVDVKDLYSPAQYCEELIGEIICDVYVSSDRKKEYSESVSSYKKNIEAIYIEPITYKGESLSSILIAEQIDENRDRFNSIIAMMVPILTAFSSLLISVLLSDKELGPSTINTNKYEGTLMLVLPVLICLITVLGATSLMVKDKVRDMRKGKRSKLTIKKVNFPKEKKGPEEKREKKA